MWPNTAEHGCLPPPAKYGASSQLTGMFDALRLTAQVARDTYDPKYAPTKAFVEAVAALPPQLDLKSLGAWIDFIETFGTHVPTQLSLGGVASKPVESPQNTPEH